MMDSVWFKAVRSPLIHIRIVKMFITTHAISSFKDRNLSEHLSYRQQQKDYYPRRKHRVCY